MKNYSIDKTMESDKEREFAINYAKCVNSENINNLGITREKYEVCVEHLATILDEHFKHMLKQRKQNQEKMRKLEEVQYN